MTSPRLHEDSCRDNGVLGRKALLEADNTWSAVSATSITLQPTPGPRGGK
jgi:hypothetical protein